MRRRATPVVQNSNFVLSVNWVSPRTAKPTEPSSSLSEETRLATEMAANLLG